MDTHPSRRHEDKVLLLLTLIIGAIVGLVVVAFILGDHPPCALTRAAARWITPKP
jgi:hypothetical protein